MFFYYLTSKPEEIKHPFIIATIFLKDKVDFFFNEESLYLFDDYRLALTFSDSASYLNWEIKKNVFWWEGKFNDFLKEYFKKIEIPSPQYVFSVKDIQENNVSFENDNSIVFLGDKGIKIYDKKVSAYFQLESNPKLKTKNYKTYFRRLFKNDGLLGKEYTLASIIEQAKEIFKEKYNLYIPVIFNTYYKHNAAIAFLSAWDNLFEVEAYMSEVRIYNIQEFTPKYDFNFQKDENGRRYIQHEYNASETVTGRMFPKNLKSYQAVQTIAKEDRKIVKAEPDCMLLEFDYKNFETSILTQIALLKSNNFFNEKTRNELEQLLLGEDLHMQTCEFLNLPKTMEGRNFAKKINFAITYGMGLEGIVNLVLEEHSIFHAERVKKMILSYCLYEISKLRLWDSVETTHGLKRTDLKIKTFFDRKIEVQKENAFLNNYIQATAADFFYYKIVDIIALLDSLGNKNKILIQNFDSVLIQLEKTVINNTNTVEKILEVFNSPLNQLQCSVKMKYGETWGEMA